MRTLLLFFAACSTSEDPAGTFDGPLDGTDAVLGLVTADDAGRLYVCGGPTTMDTLNVWIEVALDGGLTGEAGGFVVSAEATDDGWSGELVDPQGSAHPFSLRASDGADGLYEPDADVSTCAAGAVVSDGALQGVACPADALAAQVVPVGVIGVSRDPIAVRTEGDPVLEFVVVPVEL